MARITDFMAVSMGTRWIVKSPSTGVEISDEHGHALLYNTWDEADAEADEQNAETRGEALKRRLASWVRRTA